jgi:hypothetical protein
MLKPGYGHKFFFVFCSVVACAAFGYLAMDLVLSGLRIMLWGTRLVLMPILCLAVVSTGVERTPWKFCRK